MAAAAARAAACPQPAHYSEALRRVRLLEGQAQPKVRTPSIALPWQLSDDRQCASIDATYTRVAGGSGWSSGGGSDAAGHRILGESLLDA